MTTRIFKYPIPRNAPTEMPAGARILSVGYQNPEIVAWAIVDEDAPTVKRRLVVCPTGAADVPSKVEFVGTIQTPGGLVWHVFDLGRE